MRLREMEKEREDDHDIDYIRGIEEPMGVGTLDKGRRRREGRRSIHRAGQKHRYTSLHCITMRRPRGFSIIPLGHIRSKRDPTNAKRHR